ncbi:Ltp family lipoprotein [Staphylococcus epidermidis]|uniref:Ltp family lipoprotein n=1 Tax=Staphylococcus epidermidis TaxID=1282 RepID=UPI002004BACF|nr:Ltp family lipoprotein [Staphylococcus epidermidis]MCG1234810.1 Ltp family lipoprotein [Staphylococcus epidermidis]MCG1250891.1 Ltp family lipoprotein [Staphylococcus epidermidis]MCG1254182.1 Ltp family lipoprotein [Staphylococcus epidermidis]MCG1406780.1 Ltp family lipoprotein [Staphylococcus epidermidis]MCG1411463.1 Ltp family lipoprotein [Staphylococcus epidermidis]
MQQESTSWYKQEWFIVLTLIFIFPLGLFVMWRFSKWPSIAKTIITVVISVIVLASVTYYGNLKMAVPITSNSNNETKETTDTSVNDKDEENHKASVKETNGKYQEWYDEVTKGAKEEKSATRLQKAALETAKSYSDDLNMSKEKIYDILTSEVGEKFSKEDAKFAINHLNADYNKNALETAKSYAKDMHMSNDAIYDILKSPDGEKFTEFEAKYAIDHLDN